MDRRAETVAISGEKFCRMWEFYLSLCEAAFRAGINVVFQIELVKKVDAAPITREYIGAREGVLRANEAREFEAG